MVRCWVVYLISDNYWVSPVQFVPKKVGIVVAKAKNEVIPHRPVTRWRVFMDYKKLIKWTLKDHFPMPFMDQKRVVLFLRCILWYNQISVSPEHIDKNNLHMSLWYFCVQTHAIWIV